MQAKDSLTFQELLVIRFLSDKTMLKSTIDDLTVEQSFKDAPTKHC